VVIAENGQKAVNTLLNNPDKFNGILMDIQMPVMDGYTATREIRKDSRFKNLPIIAMTASALKQDRERALAAGMNDHVAKPIDVKNLFKVLSSWIKIPEHLRQPAIEQSHEYSKAVDKHHAEVAVPELAGINTETGLVRVGGNTILYLKILRRFQASQADVVERIQAALKVSDRATAEREVHTLKGVSGNIGAQALHLATIELETAIQQQENDCDAAFTVLSSNLQTVLASLASIETSETESKKISAAPDVVINLLANLKTLLADDDGDAIEIMEELLTMFKGSPQEKQLKITSDLIESYEFESALKELRIFHKGFQQ
jgi:polar amino acid transport system substrate-binding protein